ncbi:helix-turn-helix domain-containing protein [Xanthobacter oligotrophicus]|uniref:helix-turn-helix domain-containing protein n=1 Tax=Xanthobacter oligotrophicus TaxID=2607286 RepID=UPI0011F107C7|nr:LysR family transcriptional regulator [Xanthobacter oligotrophicus]MCG5236595.1 LysR family transcriptional regulator [Xanthobacter oligotrophicus]
MEIRHLRYFVAMAETGSLMKAAERLHVAQPALSVHLSNLDADMRGIMSVASLNSRPLGPTQKAVRDILVEVARQIGGMQDTAPVQGALAEVRRVTPSTLLPGQDGRHRRLRVV